MIQALISCADYIPVNHLPESVERIGATILIIQIVGVFPHIKRQYGRQSAPVFSLNPDGGGEPDGELRKAIDRDFGSFEEFKTKFVDAGAKLFGSGWVWLSKDSDGKLFITQESNAGNPIRRTYPPAKSCRRYGI